ncbi:unnamed protein product [Parajaminaea phylloscopi]
MAEISPSALTGGAGGGVLDSPGTTPPPGAITAPLDDAAGGGGGVAANEGEGDAPIPFPGEEDDIDEEGDEEAGAAVGQGNSRVRIADDSAMDTEDRPADESGADQDDEEDEEDDGDGDDDASRSLAAAGAGTGTKGKGAAAAAAAAAAAQSNAGASSSKRLVGQPGTSQLPVARVKKIILSDPDVDSCGKEATFAIGKACEIYIHHLVESAYTQARLDKRKAVVYKDVSRAIKSTPYLEFLMDVVPAAVPLSLALAERQRHLDFEGGDAGDEEQAAVETQAMDTSALPEDSLAPGDTTVDGASTSHVNGRASTKANGTGPHPAMDEHSDANMDLDPTSTDQMAIHALPPSASRAAGTALQGTAAEVEEIGTVV